MKNTHFLRLALAPLLLTASTAFAMPANYPNIGTPNPVTYSFTATATGDLNGYYAIIGGGAYDEQVRLWDTTTNTFSGYGLDDHASSYGTSFDFGHVNAGDNLVFQLDVLTTGNIWSSEQSLNSDGGNHIFSESYSGDSIVPAGTYIAFEDLQFPHSDYNYHDDAFVFANTSVQPSNVAEPEQMALLMLGLPLLTLAVRRKQAA